MRVLMMLGLWWRTGRHLRVRQAIAWLGRRWRGVRLHNLAGPAPEVRLPNGKRNWVEGCPVRRSPEQEAATRLGGYLRHYHDELRAPSNELHVEEWLKHWIASNPPGRGPAWEPYPLSRRIVNWVWWLNGDSNREFTASLAMQARALRRQIEHDLGANHLWANAKALVFAGCYFAGRESEEWLRAGRRLLREELAAQVLRDGGHIERSPMYHALVLEDVLDLLNLARRYPDEMAELEAPLREAARSMLRWFARMTHSDGVATVFGDTAPGSTPRGPELSLYAERLGVETGERRAGAVEVLGNSRYVRLERAGWTLWFDRGGVAPDYQPGHAHAAILSFELDWQGERLFAHPGISTYERNRVRQWERGTAAHNTLRLNGRDQSEMWAAFRVGRRARAHGHREGEKGGEVWAEAAHDGYAPVEHRRRIGVGRDGVRLVDRLVGRRTEWHEVELSFHLAPEWRASLLPGGRVAIRRVGSERVAWQLSVPEGLAAWVEPASIHLDFGASIGTGRILLTGPLRVGPDGVELVSRVERTRDEDSVFRGQLSAGAECASLAGV